MTATKRRTVDIDEHEGRVRWGGVGRVQPGLGLVPASAWPGSTRPTRDVPEIPTPSPGMPLLSDALQRHLDLLTAAVTSAR